MELSYEKADALVRTVGGASGEHLGAFVGSLIGKQYKVLTMFGSLSVLALFAYWFRIGRVLRASD